MIRRLFNWIRNLGAPQSRYEAANWSSDRGWLWTTYQPARLDISQMSRQQLQAKSRHWEANSDLQNRLADLFECYTSGLLVTASSSSPEYNAAAQAWWDKWCGVCDISTRQHWLTVQSQIARRWFVDGEVFVLFTRGESGRPRIQQVEAHRVFTPDTRKDAEGGSIVDGIEIDPNGRPIAYHIGEEEKDGSVTLMRRVDAKFVHHVFEPERPGQPRGIPFCSCVLNELQDVYELARFEMIAAKDASVISNVIKNATGEIPQDLLRRERYTATTQKADGTTTTEDRVRYLQERLPGRTVALQTNEQLDQFKSDRPSVVTMDYWRLLQTRICVGQGVPYVVVYPDSMQGTVYRGSLDMAHAYFKSRAQVMATLVQRVWEYVMGWANKNDETLKKLAIPDDWAKVSIRPPRAINVDVGYNSDAFVKELSVFGTDFELHYAPQGLDWRDRMRAIREQMDFAKSIGLDITPAFQPKQQQQQQPAEPKAQPAASAAPPISVNVTLPPRASTSSRFEYDELGRITRVNPEEA